MHVSIFRANYRMLLEEHVDNTGIPPYLEFTTEEFEEFATKDFLRQGNPKGTQEEFWAGSN